MTANQPTLSEYPVNEDRQNPANWRQSNLQEIPPNYTDIHRNLGNEQEPAQVENQQQAPKRERSPERLNHRNNEPEARANEPLCGCTSIALWILVVGMMVGILMPMYAKDVDQSCKQEIELLGMKKDIEAQQARMKLETEINDLKSKITRLESDNQQLESAKNQLTTKLGALKSTCEDTTKRLAELEGETKILREQNTNLKVDDTRKTAAIEQTQEKLSHTKDEMQTKQHACDLKKTELETGNTQLLREQGELKGQLGTCTATLQETSENLEKCQTAFVQKFFEQYRLGSEGDLKVILNCIDEKEKLEKTLIAARNEVMKEDNGCKGAICTILTTGGQYADYIKFPWSGE